MGLAQRVAQRFQRVAEDEFIPQGWFGKKEAEWKAVFKRPLDDRRPQDWPYQIEDRVLQWLKGYQKEFEGLISSPLAREIVKERVESALTHCTAVQESHEKVAHPTWRYSLEHGKDPLEALKFSAALACSEKMQASAKTMADLFKYEWEIDHPGLERFAARMLKKAPPDVVEALINDSDAAWRVRHHFMVENKFDASAAKFAKRTKLEWSPLKWIESVEEDLRRKIPSPDIAAPRQFDLYGMKIIVDDTTVDDEQIKEYVKYLDEAYARLRIRGLESAWYGNFFIRCEECGGANRNTGGGVGGHYHGGPDTVSCYVRPSKFVVELTVHELGHRYWFKQMSSEQRKRFTALVKTRTKDRPRDVPLPKSYPEQRLKDLKQRLQVRYEVLVDSAETIEKVPPEPVQMDSVAGRISGLVLKMIDLSDGEGDPRKTQELYDDPKVRTTRAKAFAVRDKIDLLCTELRTVTDFRSWAAELRELTVELYSACLAQLNLMVQRYNEMEQEKTTPEVRDWLDSYDKNPAPVPAVSSYGKSNIDEAFAEVFAHYVLNYDITRDQMESFRSVLSKPGSHKRQAKTIAERFEQEVSGLRVLRRLGADPLDQKPKVTSLAAAKKAAK